MIAPPGAVMTSEGEDAMVQAIRDQWLIVVAVVALVGLAVWLWRTRSKAPR